MVVTRIWQVNDAGRCYCFDWKESHAGRTSHVDQARHSEGRCRHFLRLARSGIGFRPVLSEPTDQAGPAFPGGPTDGAARLIAEKLSGSLGQTVVIENRAGGAGGTVGAKTVATAEPDGYTLLFTPPGPLVTAPLIYKNVGYDPVKDFAPVATIFSSPQVLVVNPAVPASSMQELVAYAKANPGKVSYASPGFGTQPHLLGEMLKLETCADIVHVPFRGSAPALTDL